MGTFSIWHWVIVLSIFGAPVIAIASASRDKPLPRMPYFWRAAGLLLTGGILWLYVENQSTEVAHVALAVLVLMWVVAIVVLGFLGTLWSVYRIQDIGRSKWWSLLLLVPLIALFYVIFLIFYPAPPGGQQGRQDSAMV